MPSFRCPHCGADVRRVILARLESLPAGCPTFGIADNVPFSTGETQNPGEASAG